MTTLASFDLRGNTRYVEERLGIVAQRVLLDLQGTSIIRANKPVSRLSRTFRWILINFGAAPKEVKATEINRVSEIVNIIDTREVFYVAMLDELPQYAIESVQKAREELRERSGGVWADRVSEFIVQKIQHYLAEFRTAVSKLDPMPINHHDKNWKDFERELIDLRLRIWCLVSALKRLHGDVITPLHLPHEIDEIISKARFN